LGWVNWKKWNWFLNKNFGNFTQIWIIMSKKITFLEFIFFNWNVFVDSVAVLCHKTFSQIEMFFCFVLC
jgi:hypothetical protein